MKTQTLPITRKQYMAGEASHEDFYGQFVTPSMIRYVGNHIGVERIRRSRDPHMNDIPLQDWDNLNVSACMDRNAWRVAHGHPNPQTYPWSMSGNVCVAKAAARAIQKGAGE